jgi:hypothetical protein
MAEESQEVLEKKKGHVHSEVVGLCRSEAWIGG